MARQASFQARIAQALQGDREARAWLAEQYQPFLHRCAHNKLYAQLRPVLESLDICGEVWASFWEGVQNGQFQAQATAAAAEAEKFVLDSPAQLEKLLQAMVYHKVIRAYKKGGRESERVPDLEVAETCPECQEKMEAWWVRGELLLRCRAQPECRGRRAAPAGLLAQAQERRLVQLPRPGEFQPLTSDPHSPEQTPSATAAEAETLLKVRALLSEEEKRLLDWRFEDNLTFAEIAQQLGWKPHVARLRYHDILDRLRSELRASDHE